jgi:hypothetical protein
MKYAVEAWAPDYGASIGDIDSDRDVTAEVELSIEIAEGSWTPRAVAAPTGAGGSGRAVAASPCVVFVDGISRVDAQVWIEEQTGDIRPGLCATYAAGAVRCDGAATVIDARVHRGLFTPSGEARALVTKHATYDVRASTGPADALGLAVVERMRKLEEEVARDVRDADLIVLDGLLWGRTDVPRAIGYVKSHRTPYLPAELNDVVARLAPGERTPVFLVKTAWTRFSWYLRLPGAEGHPWSGIVRCEASPDLAPTDAAALADVAAATLPRFASSPHKDARAPQNLYPIGGLERELRRRAGDSQLLYRSLRASAMEAAPAN